MQNLVLETVPFLYAVMQGLQKYGCFAIRLEILHVFSMCQKLLDPFIVLMSDVQAFCKLVVTVCTSLYFADSLPDFTETVLSPDSWHSEGV